MAIKVSQLNHADLLSIIGNILDTAQLLSTIESGSPLAFELIEFAQQAAQEASNLETTN
ncbi:hypothetical protein [Xenorhabdus sp. TS4]|uniref:hypothetical protein n=1 Tax=Xenorhabdus sp. TS4 TaxID=1873483 RepID=UPI0016575051|nr:hypothetical protein [Xenorhabdus sp. TS4]MBC8950214.1 hypothetical protein [Xenorhabdus sp. TS4]